MSAIFLFYWSERQLAGQRMSEVGGTNLIEFHDVLGKVLAV